MKECVWAKTILSCYRYIERICGAIDKVIEKKALGSFYACSCNFAKSNVLNVTDKIIKWSEKKKTLINLKVLTCDALRKCQKLNAQILIERYIEGDKATDIAERHNLPMRSYFRRLAAAERDFLAQLAHMGYGENRLNEFLCDIGWIMKVYDQYSQQNCQEPVRINLSKISELAIS